MAFCGSRISTNCGNVDAPEGRGGQEMKMLPLTNLSQPSCFPNRAVRGAS